VVPFNAPADGAADPRAAALPGPGAYHVEDTRLLYAFGGHHRAPIAQFGRAVGRAAGDADCDAVCAEGMDIWGDGEIGVEHMWAASRAARGEGVLVLRPGTRPNVRRATSHAFPRAGAADDDEADLLDLAQLGYGDYDLPPSPEPRALHPERADSTVRRSGAGGHAAVRLGRQVGRGEALRAIAADGRRGAIVDAAGAGDSVSELLQLDLAFAPAEQAARVRDVHSQRAIRRALYESSPARGGAGTRVRSPERAHAAVSPQPAPKRTMRQAVGHGRPPAAQGALRGAPSDSMLLHPGVDLTGL
jgi:hypothetical protein